MASDRQQFHRALERWDQHQTDGNFSARSADGAIALLLPYDHAKHAANEKVETFDRLAAQTLRLADHIMQTTGRRPSVAIDARAVDFEQTVTDPTISDVIVVGKGTLTTVELPSAIGWLNWRELSDTADHLKTGAFRQIVCGSRRLNLNVPLGAFVVADHRNVLAPINTYLPARASLPRLLEKLSPVSDVQRMDWQYIKDHFTAEIVYGRTDRARARIDRIEQHLRRGKLGEVLRAKLMRTVEELRKPETAQASVSEQV